MQDVKTNSGEGSWFSEERQASLPWWKSRDLILALLVFAFAMAIYLPRISSYALWDPWEPHYSQVAMEMEQNGDWLAPHYRNSTRWFSKPVMLLWMLRTSFALFGQSDGTARLPVVFIAALGLVLFNFFVGRMFRWKVGLFASLVLATSPQYYFLARQAIYDMPYVVFQMAALGFLGLGLFCYEDNPRWQYPFWIFSALAILSKGLLAIVLPGAVIGTFIIVTWDWAILKRMRFVSGLLVFMAVSIPWYAFMTAKYGTTYLHNFFIYHHFKRAMGEIGKPNATFELYIQQVAYALFPWIAFLPIALIRFLRWNDKDLEGGARKKFFIFLCVLMPFVFFEISSTKFHHYIFPLIPFLAIIIGYYLARLTESNKSTFIKLEIIIALMVFILVSKDLITNYKHFINLWIYYYSRGLPHNVNPRNLYYACFIPLGFVIALPLVTMAIERMMPWLSGKFRWLKYDGKPWRHFTNFHFIVFAALAVVLAGVNNYWLVPKITDTFSQKPLWEAYQEHATNNEPICEYHSWERRSVSYYFDNKTFYIDSRRPSRLNQFFARKGKLFCMVDRSQYHKLRKKVKDSFERDLYIVDSRHPFTYLVATEPPKQAKVKEGEYLLKDRPILENPLNIVWDDKIKLLGYKLNQEEFTVGDDIELTLYYEALDEIEDDWDIFIHFDVLMGGRMVGDHSPVDGRYPTDRWKKGDIIKDTWKGKVGKRMKQGRIEIRLGFFHNDERMPISEGKHDGERRVRIASVPLRSE